MKSKRVFLILFLLVTINFLLIVNNSQAITLTCPEEVLSNNNGSDSCTVSGCNGTVSLSVTGTGASIGSNGVLTTGEAACGGMTVTANCSDNSITTTTARVSNAGQWVDISSCGRGGGHFHETCSQTIGKDRTTIVCGVMNIYEPSPSVCSRYTNPSCLNCGGDTLNCCQMPAELCECIEVNKHVEEWQCLPCTNGPPISCYTGPGGTQGIGICQAGTQTCTNGQWGACQGEVLPSTEICDGQDNDCDEDTDEGFDVGASCSVGVGACLREGTKVCKADGSGTECNATPGDPSPEICGDDIDSDCDGYKDKNCEKPKGNSGNPGNPDDCKKK